jgi:hypothetical protein
MRPGASKVLFICAGENGEKIPNQQSEELSILIMGSKGSVRNL